MSAPTHPESGFLPPGAVRTLRARAERGMTARAEFQRLVRVKTGPGTYAETWTTVPALAAVRCVFRPAVVPRETVRADAVQALNEHELQLPYDTAGVDTTMRAVVSHVVPGLASPFRVDLTGVEKTSGPMIVQRWYGTEVAP